MYANNGNRLVTGSGFSTRCLDQTSVSIAGLLHILGRWAFMHKNSGGLEVLDQRHASLQCLLALVNAALHGVPEDGVPWSWDIDDEWAPSFVLLFCLRASSATTRIPFEIKGSIVATTTTCAHTYC